MKGLSRVVSHPGLSYLDQLEIWKGGGGFGLDNIKCVLEHLGDPQDSIRSIHVTGTNGKGTVATVVASILGAAGFKVGMNISPHLEHLNERIVVDGLPISMNLIGDYALILKAACESVAKVLSFHEAITALAFIAFRELNVDWMVIEVGLGGRLDASNVLKRPEVSVITSVDLDHQHILGETKPKIAVEKAGIIKKQSRVVVGPLDEESLFEVRRIAANQNSPVFRLNEDFSYTSIHDGGIGIELDSFEFLFSGITRFSVTKAIKGNHQLDNFSVALAVAKLVGVGDEACKIGAAQAFWPSRLEVFEWKNRIVIMDCAHNPHGVQALVDNLSAWGLKELDVAFGVLDTKDWRTMIDLLLPYTQAISLLSPQSERALDLSNVINYLSGIGINGELYGRDIDRFIRDHEGGIKPLLITGSIYLIGELRKYFSMECKQLWGKHLYI